MKRQLRVLHLFSALLLSFIFILSLTSTTVFAAGQEYDKRYTKITLHEDDSTLTCGDKTYECFSISPYHKYWLDPKSWYHYANEVIILNTESEITSYTAFATEKDAEIMWLEDNNGKVYLFATKEGRKEIDDKFVKGVFEYRRVWMSRDAYTEVTQRYIDRLQNSYYSDGINGTLTTVKVRDLKNLKNYRVAGYEKTGTIACRLGYIYEMEDGKYCYLATSQLSDSHFDDNNNLVYEGTGRVGVLMLNGSMLTETKDVIASLETCRIPHTYENLEFKQETDIADTDIGPHTSQTKILFWIVYFILGIVAPIPAIIAGCVLGRRRNKEHPKYWYSISLSGAAWLFLSLVLAAILLIT